MKILYVEDEIAHVVLAQRTLEDNLRQEFVLLHAETMKQALDILAAEPDMDLVLSDLRLPDGSGLELLKKIRQQPSPPAVVLVTGQGDQEVAVTALKNGAADYLVKQTDYLHRLPVVISNAVAQNRLLREQEALRQAEIKYQSLIEQIAAVVFLDRADEEETTIYISPRVEELTGYPPEEWYTNQKIWSNSIHPDDREKMHERSKYAHNHGTRFLEEYRLIRRDGSTVWVKEDSSLICDQNGIPLYWQGIIFDITKEKESLEAIQKSEERFRRIFHASPIATCVITLNDARFIDANQAFITLTGKSLDELVGRTSAEMGFWQSEVKRREHIALLQAEGRAQGLELQYTNVPNGPRDTLAYYETIELGGEACILAMFYDVTEEKETQKALQSERDFALQILNNMGQGLTVTKSNGEFEYVNPAYAAMLGYSPEELLGKSPKDFTAPDSRSGLERERKQRREGTTSTYESQLLHKDSHEVPALITGVPRWQDQEITGAIAVITDLTDQKKAEAALARQVNELTILHSVAIAEAESQSEDEIIDKVTAITSQIYTEVCGILLLNASGDLLTPHPSCIGSTAPDWMNSFPVSQGITGKAVSQERIVRADDTFDEPEYIEIASEIRAELCVPIRVNGKVIGVFNVESKRPRAFDENDERFLNTIASSLGTALERLRFFKEEQRRSSELNALYESTKSLAQSLEPKIIAQNLITTMDKLLGYEFASLYLVEEDSQSIAPFAMSPQARNLEMYEENMESLLSEKRALGQGIIGWVAKYGQPINTGNVSSEPRYLGVLKGIQSELCVPIIARGKVLGALNIESTEPNAYSEKDESLLTALANSAAIAFENASLYKSELTRREQAELLRTATASLSTTLELQPLLEIILNAISDFITYDSASIFLKTPGERMEIVNVRGIPHPEKFIGKQVPETARWAEVSSRHQPLIIDDTQLNDIFEEWEGTEYIRSWMGIPLVVQDDVIGYINLDSRKVHGFSERDATIAQTFANSAAIAVGNAHLYQDALRAAERRAVLHRISQDIIRFSQDSEGIYTAIHEAATKLMPCDVFLIVLHDEIRNENISVYAVEAGERYEAKTISGSKGLTGTVISEGRSIILRNNDDIHRREIIRFGSPRHVESVVAVPMRIGDKVTGMISAQCYTPYSYGAEEQALLEMLAAHAATAVENGRLFESEQRRRREAETLRQAATVISSTLDLKRLMEDMLKALKQVIHYDNASLFLHEGEWLRVAMCQGFPNAKELIDQRFPASDELFLELQQHQRPIIIRDVQIDERFQNWGNTFNVHGWMSVPLITRGKVIGYITLDSYGVGTYEDATVDTAMAFANQAAIGIENARLFQEQNRRSRIIAALADIANEIATTREVGPALDQIAQRALDLLNANNVAIYLLQKDGVTLKTVTAHGNYKSELLSHTRKAGEGITGTVFLNGKAEIINDTREDPRRVTVPGTPEREEKLESLMSSPLILRGKSIGVINAWRLREDGLFDKSELDFLIGIAHQVSICIESGDLFHETNRQAREAEAIAEVGRDISATLQLDAVLERIASYAMNLLQAETSAVYLIDPTFSLLRPIAVFGKDAAEIKDDPLTIGNGILGNIALRTMGEIVNDTASDPRAVIVKGTQREQFENIMGVPILLKDKHTGLLAIWRSGIGTEFAPRELDFLTSLARQAAVAIENARLYNEIQRRLQEMEIINRVSMSLRVAQSIEEMLPILLDEAINLVQTTHGSVWLHDSTNDKLTQRIAKGAELRLKWKSLMPSDGIIGHTFSTGAKHISPDLKHDPLLFEQNRESILPGLAAVYIPIQSTAGPVGVLMVGTENGRQISEEINLLTILAEITGNSIHRVQLYEQSQKQVRRLTTLRDIDSAIAASMDLRLTLNILMDQTLNHLNVDAVDIGIYHADIQGLTYIASAGFQTSSPTRPQIRLGEGLAGQVISRQSIIRITNLQDAGEVQNEAIVKREGFVEYIGLPLIVKGQIKGVFEIFHRTHLSTTLDWMEFLHTLAGQAAIAIDSSQLFENLQRSNHELIQAYDTTLEGWARALELRDQETEGHTRRVTEMTMQLASYMGINENEKVNIHRGVLLHDIGKMGVPDNILRKTGKLDENEWNEMRKHPVYAYNLLSPISYLRGALDIPYCHHEHWDGTGYPRGLKGEQIPLSARIFSVVDVWDALLSNRPYRKAWPREKVIQYLKDVAGTILDPKIVEIFLRMVDSEQNQNGIA